MVAQSYSLFKQRKLDIQLALRTKASIADKETAIKVQSDASTQKKKENFEFIFTNKRLITEELGHLEAVLKDKKYREEAIDADFVYICYYWSMLLAAYHSAYGQKEKGEAYIKFAENIIKPGEKSVSSAAAISTKETLAMMGSHLLDDAKSMILKASKTRLLIRFINLWRLQFLFSRLTLAYSLQLLVSIRDKFDHNFANKLHSSHKHMTQSLAQVAPIANGFSVGAFSARFLYDFGMVAKHAFYPSEEEALVTTFWGRVKSELAIRHLRMSNDFFWAIINALTNYLRFFNPKEGSVNYASRHLYANLLTVAFLIIDIAMNMRQYYIDARNYETKRAQYQQEIDDLLKHSARAEEQQKNLDMLRAQLDKLNDEWAATAAQNLFVIYGSVLILVGFLSYSLLASPSLMPISFLVCAIGIAFYSSAAEYKRYVETDNALKKLRAMENCHPGKLGSACAAQRSARNQFVFAMLENTLLSMFILTLYAISWIAALIFTVVYTGSRVAYSYHNQVNEKRKSALVKYSLLSSEESEPHLMEATDLETDAGKALST